jgi:hypothetical protein
VRNTAARPWFIVLDRNILKQFGVVAYLCGHEHNIQVQEVEGVWHLISGGVPPKLYPLYGALDDKLLNNQLYDGAFQNPGASQIWPRNDKKQKFLGPAPDSGEQRRGRNGRLWERNSA